MSLSEVELPRPVRIRSNSMLPRNGAHHPLTDREREVLSLIGDGLKDREIAVALGISVRTVEKHVEHILRKLHARNRSDAVHVQITVAEPLFPKHES